MVEQIKKERGKPEDAGKPLWSPKPRKNYPRETPIKVPFITRCWEEIPDQALLPALCAASVNFVLFYSSPLKHQNGNICCLPQKFLKVGITSHQVITQSVQCGRRSHLTRIIQELVLGRSLTAVTNWAVCTNPHLLRLSLFFHTQTKIKSF